jgi:hypothetical protein
MSKPRRITELTLTTTPSISDLLAIARPGSNNRISLGTLVNSEFPATFGNTTINGDLDVNGNLRVSKLVSSSILYESGSTLFGNTMDDTHTFTGSIYLTGSISSVSTLTFDTNAIPATLPEYSFAANTTDKTVDLRMGNNSTIQLGQELQYPPVVNKGSVDIVNGTLLMIRVSDISQGQRLAVQRWDGTQGYPADYIVGVATEDIAKNAEGQATYFGYVRGISITELESAGAKDPLETWEEGQILYPHPTLRGGLTNVKPTSPNVKSTIAVIVALNGINLTILVRPKFGSRITELYDVDFDTAVTGSIIYKGPSGDGTRWGTTENSIKVIPPHLILTEVSESLDFANDGLAAAGGVPLGGLYRNGNVIQIRIV